MATNEDLHIFVKDALVKGASRPDVEQVLLAAGWSAPQTRAALGAFADVSFPVPVPRPRPSLDARDTFLYFILFTTLYVSAYHFGSLIFDFINRWVPDPAFGPHSAYMDSALRWSLASLIIAVPVFLFVSHRTARAVQADPAKRGSKARRWLTYLTLSIASMLLIGDFITLVYYLLSGELSVRFVLKAVTVAVIAGGAFTYYLWDLRSDEMRDQKGVAS